MEISCWGRFPLSDIYLLKKGNVEPVKSSFNEEGLIIMYAHKNRSFRSHKTRKSNDNAYAGGIVMQFMKFLLFCYTGL